MNPDYQDLSCTTLSTKCNKARCWLLHEHSHTWLTFNFCLSINQFIATSYRRFLMLAQNTADSVPVHCTVKSPECYVESVLKGIIDFSQSQLVWCCETGELKIYVTRRWLKTGHHNPINTANKAQLFVGTNASLTFICEMRVLGSFYRTVLHGVWYCYGKSSTCLSVCDVEVSWSGHTGWVTLKLIACKVRPSLPAAPDIINLVHEEQPQIFMWNRGWIWKNSSVGGFEGTEGVRAGQVRHQRAAAV